MTSTNPSTLSRDLAADAAIALLAETWPSCFSVYERRRRPLQLGIHHHILAALDGAVILRELRRALGYYTGNTWYLRATVAGAARIGLDGNAAGAVTAEEAAAAAARLASRKRKSRQGLATTTGIRSSARTNRTSVVIPTLVSHVRLY
jgi:ProP effector